MRAYEREYVRGREMWSPVNPLALFYRHLFEEEITRLFRREGIDLKGKHIIEPGCGYGEKTKFLIELGAEPANVYGFDADARVVERAAGTLSGPNFAVADGREVPYPDGAFDVAAVFLYTSVLEPATIRPPAVKEIIRVLRPGGYILWYDTVETGGGYLWGLGPADIKNLFGDSEYKLGLFGLKYKWATRIVYKSYELARLIARAGVAPSHVVGLIKPSL